MHEGSLVVLWLSSPREKFWGVLLSLSPSGVMLRGLPLEAFEDFLLQCAHGSATLPNARLGATTVFFPAHRIERMELDETSGAVEGFADRFRRLVGRDPQADLMGEEKNPSRPAPQM
ncbi:MAG: hypothetical protein N2447_07165 [Thermoanaerobaculum sp.]|nr:hypothetical protein [Thermoanaerobaculum sp.]